MCIYFEFLNFHTPGLDAILLDESPPFNDATVAMIECFLRQYQSPIALVAHNGLRFDFPILRRQLVSNHIYCVVEEFK